MVRRRDVLRTVGAIAAGGMLAGCQDIGEVEEEPGPEAPEREEFPSLSGGEPGYREWIPARSELDIRWATAVNFARLRDRKQRLSAAAYERLGSWATRGDYFGAGFADIEGQIIAHLDALVVHLGNFDRSTVQETLTATGYEDRGTRGTVGFYLDDSRDRAFAVGDQGVIESRTGASESFPDKATTLFETAAGERPRRYREHEPFRLFVDDVGWPLSVTIPRELVELDSSGFEDAIPTEAWYDTYYGTAQHVASGAMVTRHWFGVPDDQAAANAVRSSFEEAAFTNINEEEIGVRGTTSGAEVAALAPFETTGGGRDPVRATLAASLDDGTLLLDHRAGDPIPPERVRVEWNDSEYSPSEPIEPGETHRVEREFTDTVSVLYLGSNGETLALLAQADGG